MSQGKKGGGVIVILSYLVISLLFAIIASNRIRNQTTANIYLLPSLHMLIRSIGQLVPECQINPNNKREILGLNFHIS